MSPAGSVLIVQTAFPGDTILAAGLVRTIREEWPDLPVGIVVRPDTEPIARMMDPTLEVIVYDKRSRDRGRAGLEALAVRLRGGPWSAALVPHRSLRSAWLVRRAGLRPAVGFDLGAGAGLLTHRVPYRRGVHEVERNHDLLAALARRWGRDVPPRQPPLLVPGSGGLREAEAVLVEWGDPEAPPPFVALAPGSVWPTKRWPVGYWAVLALELTRRDLRVVWIGGEEDALLCGALAEAAPGSVTAAGSLGWPGTAALLNQAHLLVANDSAPVHLAAAVGCPTLALFGPTLPGFGFAPLGRGSRSVGLALACRPCRLHGGRRCPEGHFRCMLDLTPTRVAGAAADVLATAWARG
jgi:heptosyltransferase-2